MKYKHANTELHSSSTFTPHSRVCVASAVIDTHWDRQVGATLVRERQEAAVDIGTVRAVALVVAAGLALRS